MQCIDKLINNNYNTNTMVPIEAGVIAELESKLAIILPSSYKYLIATYGLVHSPNVMTKTCDLSVDVSEVQDFLSLDDVFSLSKLYEMGGMPKGHILFASDSRGNMYCFKRADCLSQQLDVPVWFFNNDLRTFEKVSNSFVEWLVSFEPY